MAPLALASIPCAVLPILGFLWLIWWLDRYDREPVGLFLLVFAWGAVGAVGLAMLGSALFALPIGALADPDVAASIALTFLAPAVEEPSKAAILFLVARSKHFDNVTDGFVYGAAAGLGFGMTENLMYFLHAAADGDALAWVATVAVRTLYSALMHAGATSLIGAAIGLARNRRGWSRPLLLALGFAAACGMHALWNGLLALAEAGQPLLGLVDLLIFPLEFLVLLGLFQLCLVAEHGVLRRELTEEADLGTLPLAHVPLLSSYLRRARAGWLPHHVDHHAYVRLATTLALRRAHHKQRGVLRVGDRELEALREGISALLSTR